MTLTFEQVDQLLAYDPATGELRWKVARGRHGNACKAGSVAGSVNSRGYIQVGVHGRLYQAHRLAWLLHHGAWPSQQIDHIDRDRTNNRIDNLRECSNSENQQNVGKRSDNKSGVQGGALAQERQEMGSTDKGCW
ncbi:hypothetical protein [Xanthomonas phage L522]|nr:hypothetical protein [Xanthomonas phage L522]